jgi:hypothetical protein
MINIVNRFSLHTEIYMKTLIIILSIANDEHNISSLYQKETIAIYCTFLYKFYKKVLTLFFFIVCYDTIVFLY